MSKTTSGPIRWSETLASGEPLIDAEHREIIEWLALVAAAACSQDPPPGAYHAIRYLERFWLDHIQLEEHFMAVHTYGREATDLHREAHREFALRLRKLSEGLDAIEPAPTIQGEITSLAAWIEQHIESLDRELIAFIRDQSPAKQGG